MSSEWVETCVGEIASKVTKGTTPTSVGFSFLDEGVNYVKSESITFDGVIDQSKFSFIGLDAHEKLKRSQLEAGDILFSMAGVYIGKTAVVGKSILPANTNQAVGIIRLDKSKALPNFIDYCLRNPRMRVYANSLVAQSAQPNLNLAEISGLPISLPSLIEQKVIAHILGTLDNKIEINRKTNETLEGIAKAVFKSWFVDFDPVRARAEGRSTGLPDEISELFPDSFEESELGEIPSGWEVLTWGDLIKLEYGKSLKGYKDSDESIPVYGTNGMAGHTGKPLVDAEGIIVGRKGAYRGIHYSDEPFYVIDTAFYVASKTDQHLFTRWCFYSMKSIDMESIDSGSAIPSTSREDFYSIEFVCPSRNIQEFFEQLLAPAWRRQKILSEESMILESLRNSLLPRLISGELRVPDAEKMLEEVGI